MITALAWGLLALAAVTVLIPFCALAGPWAATGPAGAVLGFVVGSVLRVRRRHVLRSVAMAGIPGPERVAGGMYQSLGRGLCELLWVGLRPDRELDERIVLGPSVRRLVAAGRGVVIATAHTGNWDLLACAAAREVPLTVVTKHLSIGWLDRVWQGIRRQHRVRLVSVGEASRAALDALRAGEAVAMLIDQAPERRRGIVNAPFLGQVADVDLAPALLALRARVPLAVVTAERDEDGVQRAVLLAEFDPPERPSRAWAERTMIAATAALEAHIRRRPEQWLWMHRRWKRAV